MRFPLVQCAWFGIALTTLALAPITSPRIIPNQLASNAPNGVNVFLAYTPEKNAEPGSDQAAVKALTQLCWGGERGAITKTFRLTALYAFDAAGNAIKISPMLGDANHAAWRDASAEAEMIGDSPAFALGLLVNPVEALAKITKISGTLELKLGKNVIRIPPQARQINQISHSSLLEAKGFKLTELGEQQRFNLQFAYANEKKGAPPNLFLVNSAGKPIYSSKPRQSDGLVVVKILPTESIPPDTKFRIGVDKSKTIDGATKLFQSKELLTAALAKRGLKVSEYSCTVSTVFSVEITRIPTSNIVPEVVLDFAGKQVKGQSVVIAGQQDPNAPVTTSWSFEIPLDMIGKRPDVLVLLTGDEGQRSIQFEFHDPFAN